MCVFLFLFFLNQYRTLRMPSQGQAIVASATAAVVLSRRALPAAAQVQGLKGGREGRKEARERRVLIGVKKQRRSGLQVWTRTGRSDWCKTRTVLQAWMRTGPSSDWSTRLALQALMNKKAI